MSGQVPEERRESIAMHEVVLIVFAVTALFALVSLILPLAARMNFPYAVLLAIAGCWLGGAISLLGADTSMGPISELLHALGRFNLTSEAFLYIFLPALLFEAALTTDVSRLLDEMAPILLLAVVAVLVSTFVVGFALWPVAEVGLLACLLLGAILATTDPVAVVAIFRDIGAPQRLSVLVEGESLLNDAAAIALFTLLAAMLTGVGASGPLDAVITFVWEFVGGFALGLVTGRLTCAMLPMFRDHRLAEATLTIALAYLTFIIGEHYFHVSGVVAVVGAGLVLGHQGRRELSPSRWRSLTGVWEQLGFWASSLIFILAAMLVPRMLAQAEWKDFVLLAVVVASAFAARAITLFGLMPLLTAMGVAERVDTSYKLVILWGGMRGAVSLALALAATENAALSPEIRQFVAILATGFVLFTLLVNAPTLRPFIRLLALDRLSPEELALRDRAMAIAHGEIRENIKRVAQEHGVNHEVVEETSRVFGNVGAPGGTTGVDDRLDPDLRAYSGLTILVEREQELCMRHFETRTISRRAVAELMGQCGRLRDGIKAGGLAGYREAAAATLAFSRSFQLGLALQRRAGIEWLLAQAIADRLEVLLAQRLVLQDLERFTDDRVQRLLGVATAALLGDAVGLRLQDVGRAIAAIELQYPSYAENLKRQLLMLSAIRMEDENHRRLRTESIISQDVFTNLQRDLRQRRYVFERRPRLDLGLNRTELVERLDLFATLDPAKRASIARLLRPHLAVPGEMIVRRGERGDAMYFISSGAVEVKLTTTPVQLGTGQFFGELALIDDRPRTSDVVSLGFCQLLSLSRRDFERLLQENQALRTQIHAVAEQRRARA